MNQALGRDVRVRVQHQCRREFLGSDYGGWCICPENLTADSVVYSFGVGEDISFDLALIERFGLRVMLLIPTPERSPGLPQSLPDIFFLHDSDLRTTRRTRFTCPPPISSYA